jgi:hypothetical protein
MFVAETESHERQAMDEVYDRLQRRFEALSPREIGVVVHEVADGFSGAKVRDFVPVLVEHIARERLAGHGHAADGERQAA